MFHARCRVDEAFEVKRVVVRAFNVGARIGLDRGARVPEGQQEKVHAAGFSSTQQLDPAIARVGLIVTNSEVGQVPGVRLCFLDGDDPTPEPGDRFPPP